MKCTHVRRYGFAICMCNNLIAIFATVSMSMSKNWQSKWDSIDFFFVVSSPKVRPPLLLLLIHNTRDRIPRKINSNELKINANTQHTQSHAHTQTTHTLASVFFFFFFFLCTNNNKNESGKFPWFFFFVSYYTAAGAAAASAIDVVISTNNFCIFFFIFRNEYPIFWDTLYCTMHGARNLCFSI